VFSGPRGGAGLRGTQQTQHVMMMKSAARTGITTPNTTATTTPSPGPSDPVAPALVEGPLCPERVDVSPDTPGG